MRLKKDILIATIIFMALVMSFYRYITGSDFFLLIYFILTGIGLGLHSPNIRISKAFPFVLIVSAFSFFILPVFIDSEQSVIFHLYSFINVLSAFINGYLIYKNPYRLKIALSLFSLALVFFFYHVYKIGLTNLGAYNTILAEGSRNIIAAYLLFLTIFLIGTYDQKKLEIPSIFLILTFICCLILFGRAGIALSFLLLLFFTFNRYNIYYKMLLAGGSILLLIYFSSDLYLIINERTNFGQGLESPRTVMFNEYFSDLTIKEALIGQSFSECCNTILQYKENPHNSFIKGHSRYGIIHTIVFAYIFSKIMLKNKRFFVLGLVLLIKYSTDTIGLFAPIDFVLFYLLLLTYPNAKISYPMSYRLLA